MVIKDTITISYRLSRVINAVSTFSNGKCIQILYFENISVQKFNRLAILVYESF